MGSGEEVVRSAEICLDGFIMEVEMREHSPPKTMLCVAEIRMRLRDLRDWTNGKHIQRRDERGVGIHPALPLISGSLIEKIRGKLASWIAEEVFEKSLPKGAPSRGLRLKAKFGRFILFKSRR